MKIIYVLHHFIQNFVDYLCCTPSKLNAAFYEGMRIANAQAALICDMSPEQIILGYHDIKSKRELIDDLHKHFIRQHSENNKKRLSFYKGSSFPWRIKS